MCEPLAIASLALTGAGMVANQGAASRHARATQEALDRDTEISRQQFDDRNERLREASATNLDRAQAGFNERNAATREMEQTIADLMMQSIGSRISIGNEVNRAQVDAADGFNAQTAAARGELDTIRREGDAAVDAGVAGFDFGRRQNERAAAADRRNDSTQATISAPTTSTSGLSGVVARATDRAVADKVDFERNLGRAAATVDGYSDLLRSGDDVLGTMDESLNGLGRATERSMTTLSARLAPYLRSYNAAADLGSARLADILEANATRADFAGERGNRIIGSSADNETTLASILDSYTGSMNAASSNYEEALRRNAQIRLNGTPRTSSIGQLFTTLGGTVGQYAAAGRGPSWGQVRQGVGDFFSPARRPISGYQTTVY